MNSSTVRAYKRKCFQGRGTAVRWMDRAFFSALIGVCLYVLRGGILVLLLLFAASMAMFTFLDVRRWDRFRQKLWQGAASQLRREDWLTHEAEHIRQEGGVILFPVPDKDSLTGLCLRWGRGTSFHCFGEVRKELAAGALAYGCSMTFHSWQEGAEPGREQVLQRLERDAPKRDTQLWRRLLQLPGNRYVLAGCLLLLMSILLRHALYWRLLGSLCLLIGAVRRSFHIIPET